MLRIEKLKRDNALDRRSPFHQQLIEQGAQFGQSSGWAYPLWFDHHGEGETSRRAAHESEHRATRETVGLYDFSLLSHVLVIGPDAQRVLDWLSTSAMDVALGRAVYTQWCDDHGLILNDLIIVRQSFDEYLLVVGDNVQERTHQLLRDAIDELDASAFVIDLSSGLSLLSVVGPLAREVLQPFVEASLTDECFPHMTSQEITFDDVPVTAMRVSFTGEPTWELHVGAEYAPGIYEQLSTAVLAAGGRPCGIDAVYSCGTENGCLDYGCNLDGTVTPLEAGLSFTISWNKPGGFRGRDVLLERQAAGDTTTRIVFVKALDSAAQFGDHDELLRDGVAVGRNSMSTYGFTVQARIGVAKVHHNEGVTAEWLAIGEWMVRSSAGHVAVTVTTKPLHGRTQIHNRR